MLRSMYFPGTAFAPSISHILPKPASIISFIFLSIAAWSASSGMVVSSLRVISITEPSSVDFISFTILSQPSDFRVLAFLIPFTLLPEPPVEPPSSFPLPRFISLSMVTSQSDACVNSSFAIYLPLSSARSEYTLHLS